MFWEPCIGNIVRAQAAGFPVGVYMFPWRAADASSQVSQLLGNLSVRVPQVFPFLRFPPHAADANVQDAYALVTCYQAAHVQGVKQVMLDIEVRSSLLW